MLLLYKSWRYYYKFDSKKSLGVYCRYVKMPLCSCEEHGLGYVTFYVQKHITHLVACSGSTLARYGPLGAPAFVTLAYWSNGSRSLGKYMPTYQAVQRLHKCTYSSCCNSPPAMKPFHSKPRPWYIAPALILMIHYIERHLPKTLCWLFEWGQSSNCHCKNQNRYGYTQPGNWVESPYQRKQFLFQ